MKRTRLRRKAKVSKRRRQREAEQPTTPKGVPYEQVRDYLPSKVSDWPQVVRVLDKPNLRRAYLEEVCGVCPLCHERQVTEVHHICGGYSRGRADEPSNLIALCGPCHREIQSVPSEFERVLRAKQEQDPEGCDWIRLTLLFGRFLPDFTMKG